MDRKYELIAVDKVIEYAMLDYRLGLPIWQIV